MKLLTALLLLLPMFCLAQRKAGQALLDSFLAEIPRMKEDTNGVQLMYVSAFLYGGIDPDEGLKWAEKAIALAQKIGWRAGEAEAYNNLGYNYQCKGLSPKALDAYFKGLRINEEIGDKHGVGVVAGNIGALYLYEKDYLKALEWQFKCLKNAEELGNKKLIRNALANIGTVYTDQGKPGEALKYQLRSLRLTEQAGDQAGIIINTGNIGITYLKLKQFPTSLAYSLKALRMAEEIGDKQGIAVYLGNAGEAYYLIAKDSAAPKPDSLVSASRAANLALAIEYLNKGIAACRELEYYSDLDEFSEYLSKALALKGDYKGALAAYQQYVAVKDSLFNTANSENLAALETKRALELKEKDIIISQLAVAKKRNERAYFIAGIVLLLISMGIAIKNIQHKKLKEKQAAQLKTMIDTQESERKRISRDLHDDVGTKLSALGLFLSSMKEKAMDSSPEIFSLAESSEQFIREAVQDLRQLLLDLSPSVLENFGYTIAIEGLVKKINETKLVHFNMVIFGMKERLKKDDELALYRITQELINNVLKHASAKNVTLQIGLRDDLIVLMIEDDGKGFELAAHAEGYGLKNLSARTSLMQGKMTIDSALGRGTSVLIEIPFKTT